MNDCLLVEPGGHDIALLSIIKELLDTYHPDLRSSQLNAIEKWGCPDRNSKPLGV